jgi:penicillin-binding protein 1A
MVAANATFANKGTYVQPTFITRIEDKNGKVLEEFMPTTDEVFSEQNAYAIIQLMRGVVDYGTGARLRSKYNLRNEIAGKTGTTQNNADGWFMGLTPELVAGCWTGGEERSIHFNSTNEGQGASMALPIWGKFFQKIYADKTLKLTKAGFQKPTNMGDVELDCSAYDAANELEISDHTFENEY